MHNDVLLIFRAILLFYEPYQERGSVKTGQQETAYRGIKINHKLHFNKVLHVAVNYWCILLVNVFAKYEKKLRQLAENINKTVYYHIVRL